MLSAGAGIGDGVWRAIKKEAEHRKVQAHLYANAIALAQHYLDVGEYNRAEDTLDLCPPHLRRVEWYYLRRQAHRDVIALRGHTDLVTGVQYSPDGKRVATASKDGTVRVWDAASGEELLTLRGHRGGVRGVGFAGEGRWLVTGPGVEDQEIKFWDADSGRELKSIASAGDLLATCRQGISVATISRKKVLTVWEVPAGRILFRHSLLKDGPAVTCLALSPDGRYLAAGGCDKLLKLWNLGAGREVPLEVPQGEDVAKAIRSVAFSTRGQYLAAGSEQLGLWEVTTGKRVDSVSGPGDLLSSSISFSRDDKWIAASDHQGLVRVWDRVKLKAVPGPRQHNEVVAAVAFSPRDERQLAVTRGLEVTLENIGPTNVAAYRILGSHPRAPVVALAYSPDGRHVASRAGDGEIILWDVDGRGTPRPIGPAASGGERATLTFSPDGRLLVSGCGNELQAWEAATGRPSDALRGAVKTVGCAAFSRDGHRLATTDGHAGIVVWDRDRDTQLLSWSGGREKIMALVF